MTYGGTSAGVIAAVQAKKMGKTVLIVSPDKHLGGLTSSGLGWTDSGNNENWLAGILGYTRNQFSVYADSRTKKNPVHENTHVFPDCIGPATDKALLLGQSQGFVVFKGAKKGAAKAAAIAAAKSLEAERVLRTAFEHGGVQKRYLALVEGEHPPHAHPPKASDGVKAAVAGTEAGVHSA